MFVNIEIERIRRHMSKSELAKKLATTTPILNDWICKRRAIPAGKLIEMSSLFDGCSVDYLLK
jgi:DNA-binding transcriptional regulator YiaG